MAKTRASDEGIAELASRLANGSDAPTRVMAHAREVFDEGIERTRHFEEALMHVFCSGYLLGRDAAPKRKSRAKAKGAGDGQASPGADRGGADAGVRDP